MIDDDPTVTDPENYRLLWENDFVRVLDYTDIPGTTTREHRHPNSVMVVLSDLQRRLSTAGRTFDTTLATGEVVWLPAQRHAGENTGPTPTHTVLIELKGAAAGTPSGAALGPEAAAS